MPLRYVVLILLLAPTAAAQSAATGRTDIGALRARGAAELAVGDRSAAARHFGDAARLDRRHARTHLAHALALDDRGAARRALDRALRTGPEISGVWAAHLRDLRRVPGPLAYSSVDGRRRTAARRLLALDSASVLGHLELATRAVEEYAYHRRAGTARQQWNGRSWYARRGLGAARTARGHLGAALRHDARSPEAHRLAARLALLQADRAAFDDAARRALGARPYDGEAWLAAAAAAWRLGETERADTLARGALLRVADPDALRSPARFVRPADRAAWTADSAAWAAAFWQARDVRRLTLANDRWLEHLARTVEADLLFGTRTARAGRHTDRGDTWIRYGPPRGRVWSNSLKTGAAESWVYDDLAFRFEDPFMSGRYAFGSSADGLDTATRARGVANTVGERDGLAAQATLDAPFVASAFRGADGRTDLVVAYGVPAGDDAEGLVWAAGAEGPVVAEHRSDGAGRPGDAVRPGVQARAATFALAPGPARLGAEVQRGTAFGLAAATLDVPAFGGAGLQTSDLLLAAHVADLGEPPPPGAVRRGDTWVQPLPFADVAQGEPLWAYAEVYGLRLEAGRSRFEVEARLAPADAPRGLRRLLGRRGGPSVAAATRAEGDRPDDAAALLLDLAGQRPGTYRLTLTVTDRVAGTSAEASRLLRLDPPR